MAGQAKVSVIKNALALIDKGQYDRASYQQRIKMREYRKGLTMDRNWI